MNKNTCDNAESSCCVADTQSIIPSVQTSLNLKDILGAWKARWGINRNNYKITPGIYKIGKPDNHSLVFVSSNYKLTFDTVRKNLSGLDCWLLLLDTKGVNVWCAAGKGTFGTCELVNRIEETGLKEIVKHRKLILPQLGAPGISAHEVYKRSEFSVIYGPVRADDIKNFISSNYRATKKMRTVKFTVLDRIVLIPMEFVQAVKIFIIVSGVLLLLNLFTNRSFGLHILIIFFASIFTGSVLTQVLLPIIPGRAFAFKGWLLGLITTGCIAHAFNWFNLPNLLLGIGYMLLLPAASAFIAMNFTGASTYTSFSGVIKEMKIAVPIVLLSTIAGVIILLIKIFIG